MRVLIVIPAYNEQESILDVVGEVCAAGYDYVVVNDGSTDDTARVCAQAHVNVITLPQNLGIGGAVQTGHLYARDHGYDVDVQVDGDGQHDIAYVPRLLDAIAEGADLAIGSRFVGGEGGFRSTALRRMGIGWLRGCIARHAGITVSDPTSGFRASGRRAIELFARRYPVDYPEPESVVYAHNSGLSVCEVGVAMRPRRAGVSSIGVIGSVYYMIKVTLAIAIEGMRSSRGR